MMHDVVIRVTVGKVAGRVFRRWKGGGGFRRQKGGGVPALEGGGFRH